MNRRAIVIAVLATFVTIFGIGHFYPGQHEDPVSIEKDTFLERPYSPKLGSNDAPVTVVEFFDPACEACRAFHPVVKQMLAKYPKDVRLVIRYTPFHKGSEEVIRLLEAARLQDVFEPILEAVLAAQPKWAAHGAPKVELAWAAAKAAGLDVERARKDILDPEITFKVNQDKADVEAAKIRGTPTFFVNGKPLPSFGAQELLDLVKAEVEAARSKSSAGG